MKKRVIAMILAACTALSMVGCGKLSNDVITINQYKGLEIEKQVVAEVTDEDVENSIASTLDQYATYKKIKNRAVENGDIITLDYSGKVDGEKFDGGTAEDQELTIGSGQFIPGFEEQLIGHKIGETFDIDVTFPEEYQNSPDLAGKPAVFTVTIDAIKVKKLPELTKKMLKKIGTEAKTVEEYREQVREDLKKSNEEAAESSHEQALWTALIDNCVVENYPADEYNEIEAQISSQYGYYAQMYGMEVDAMIEQMFGLTLDEMVKNLLKQQLAVELIAKKEKLDLTDKEYQEKAAAYVEQYGYESVEKLEETAGKENLEKMFLQEKVADFLLENAVEVEKKTETEESK